MVLWLQALRNLLRFSRRYNHPNQFQPPFPFPQHQVAATAHLQALNLLLPISRI